MEKEYARKSESMKEALREKVDEGEEDEGKEDEDRLLFQKKEGKKKVVPVVKEPKKEEDPEKELARLEAEEAGDESTDEGLATLKRRLQKLDEDEKGEKSV